MFGQGTVTCHNTSLSLHPLPNPRKPQSAFPPLLISLHNAGNAAGRPPSRSRVEPAPVTIPHRRASRLSLTLRLLSAETVPALYYSATISLALPEGIIHIKSVI
ncbi:hypothetical protein Hypma_007170 [Hypsizygus marmoreus]|uniref:Uncharacterized protein n=1 Tax=Hypsizygus marmoreus TaxID=39966 RepID=A0A369KEQ5_HYPMA|nr:hypothetical protein Hypma_007170 [Hypsizygus marmoreus]